MVLPDALAVDVPALELAATGVEAAAVTLSDARSSSEANLAPGDGTGWHTAAIAREAAVAWSGHLEELTGEVRELGRNLAAAAQRIRTTDEASGQDITGAAPR